MGFNSHRSPADDCAVRHKLDFHVSAFLDVGHISSAASWFSEAILAALVATKKGHSAVNFPEIMQPNSSGSGTSAGEEVAKAIKALQKPRTGVSIKDAIVP